MIKEYLHLFQTQQEHDTVRSWGSGEYKEPWVAYVKENEGVSYNKTWSDRYLTFEALEPCTFSFTQELNYSLDDGKTWNVLPSGTSTPTITASNKICFKAELSPYDDEEGWGEYIGIGIFESTGRFNAMGNPISLLYGDNFEGIDDLSSFEEAPFKYFFLECDKLVSAKDLALPATKLCEYCYFNMFSGCTSLMAAPSVLPATALAASCCEEMFKGCISLTTVPSVLPATILATYCYYNMFAGCTSLEIAPKLPATTLAEGCYRYMFSGCTSLVTAPELPATTLAPSCYSNMFNGCTSLIASPRLHSTTLAPGCYGNMFFGTNVLPDISNIDFTSESVVASGGLSGLFAGTNITDEYIARILPKNSQNKCYLPVTSLTSSCYAAMFSNCTSLTVAPELPATTLAGGCYSGMFAGCTSLTVAPELPASTLSDRCYADMFSNCTSLSNAPELPAATLASNCYQSMFRGCTSLTTAPELPATTLYQGCYGEMFRGCTSLTTAPELPATTLVQNCYAWMFANCTNLNYIKAMFTTTPSANYNVLWVDGVASSGTFVKNSAATWTTRGTNGVPNNWTIQTASS